MLSKKFLFLAATAATFFVATLATPVPDPPALVCPANSLPNAAGTRCACIAGYRTGSNNGNGSVRYCYPNCPPNQYPKLNDNSSPVLQADGSAICISCPLFSTSTGLTKSCTCSPDNVSLGTNPAGQVRACGCPPNSSLSGDDCVCNAGFYSGGTQANGKLKRCYQECPVNQYPELTNDGYPTGLCVACPKFSTSNGKTFQCTCQATNPRIATTAAGQTSECGCPANASKNSSGNCVCDSGFYSGGTNGNGSLARCYNVCPANFYPVLSNNSNPLGGCTPCPDRATSTGTQKSCTCSTTRLTTNAAGQANKCAPCPTGTIDDGLGGCAVGV